MKTNHTVYIHPSSSLFQSQPPVKTVLYYELVMTSKSYMRFGLTIITFEPISYIISSLGRWWRSSPHGCLKVCRSQMEFQICCQPFLIVAPHYFKSADLEQLAAGDKKMPKAIGASSSRPWSTPYYVPLWVVDLLYSIISKDRVDLQPLPTNGCPVGLEV